MLLPQERHQSLVQSRRRYLSGNVREFLSTCRNQNLARIIASALTLNPDQLLSSFAAPAINSAIRCHQNRLGWPGFKTSIDQAVLHMPQRLLFELASRGLLPAGASFDCTDPVTTLPLPSMGIAVEAPAGSRGWRFENGLLTLLTAAGTGPALRIDSSSLARGRKPVQGMRSELAYVLLEGPIRLALRDDNPIASGEAHPEKNGNSLNLGGHSEEDWRSALVTALSWIREGWPALYEEMELLLQLIVPVGYNRERHFSASFREAIGTVYLSLHPDPVVLVDALIHEFQHNKLNLLSFEDSVLHNAHKPLYHSPVRPDPRPLWGILMAVHAFAPVAIFRRRLLGINHPASRTPQFVERLREIDAVNEEGLSTLRRHGDFTPIGQNLISALAKACENRALTGIS